MPDLVSYRAYAFMFMVFGLWLPDAGCPLCPGGLSKSLPCVQEIRGSMIKGMGERPSQYILLLIMILFMSASLLFSSCSKREKPLTDQELYGQAMDYMGRKKYLRAGEFLDRLEEEYPESPLMADARLKRAEIHFQLKEFDDARSEYERFLNLHPVHEKADLARLRIALTFFNQILSIDRDQTATVQALEAFERFLKEYPKSPLVSEVRENIATCRLKLADHDLYVARFYLITGAYQSSRGRLQKIWRLYPDVPWRDEVLYLLSETYRMEGMNDEARHVECQLYQMFPESPFLEKIQFPCQEIDPEFLS